MGNNTIKSFDEEKHSTSIQKTKNSINGTISDTKQFVNKKHCLQHAFNISSWKKQKQKTRSSYDTQAANSGGSLSSKQEQRACVGAVRDMQTGHIVQDQIYQSNNFSTVEPYNYIGN